MANLRQIALYIDDGRKETKELIDFLDFLKSHNYDPVVLINNLGTISTKYPTMCSEALWSFKGPVVAESFLAARYLLEYPTRAMKYFWIRDADWTNPNFNVIDQISVHKDPTLIRFFTDNDLWNLYTKVWGNKNAIFIDDLTKGELL